MVEKDISNMNPSPQKSKGPIRLLDRLHRSPCMDEKAQSLDSVANKLNTRQTQREVIESPTNEALKNWPSLLIFQYPNYSSTNQSEQQDFGATVNPSDNLPNKQSRRGSIREVVGGKVSGLGRRLSQQWSPSSRKSSQSQGVEQNQGFRAGFKNVFQYLKQLGGGLLPRAEYVPPQATRPNALRPPQLNVQRTPEPSPPLRPIFMGTAPLTATPVEEPEYDPAEAELSIRDQCEELDAALREVNEHEMKCGPMHGLCDHKYKTRSRNPSYHYPRERKMSGRVFNYMEQAVAASRNSSDEE